MIVKKLNEFLVKNFGIKITRARPTFELARKSLINTHYISLVIDGGANRGQWATAVIDDFPALKVLSIEPVISAYNELVVAAMSHKKWDVLNVALSDRSGTAMINVSNNSEQSSSLLHPDSHLDYYPSVKFTGIQETKLLTLDSLEIPISEVIYLKLDLQGHELNALKGGVKLLKQVNVIELEMSTIEMYQDQSTFLEVANFLNELGFKVFTFADAFRSEDGQTIYIDVLFAREA
jgi:FkbM family methyltransferase